MTPPAHRVQDTLTHLAGRLDAVIASHLAAELHGLPWTQVLIELDRAKGIPAKQYASSDLQAQLRMLTERLGGLGFPFDDKTRLTTALGSELRVFRNRWAHNDELGDEDAYRAADSGCRLLGRLGDVDGAVRAEILRKESLAVLAVLPSVQVTADPPTDALVPDAVADDVVPPPAVLTRGPSGEATPTIGQERIEYQPWLVTAVGPASVLEDLPKKAAKEQVRAVAQEIVEAEGPVHLDRLVRLVGASFGAKRLHAKRWNQIAYQVRHTEGLTVDADKFAWPDSISADEWREFRPNASSARREFMEISPVEIANAIHHLVRDRGVVPDDALAVETLSTFGRKRRTAQVLRHLDHAMAIAASRGDVELSAGQASA